MGFITEWKVIGPFDNSDRRGFGVDFSEKNNIELEKEYEGKNGGANGRNFLPVTDLVFYLNRLLVIRKKSFATIELESSAEQSVQFRIGSKNAWTLG